jgi:hypothetical protein
MTARTQVFAVVRFDLYLLDVAPIESCVTVKEIVKTSDEAAKEVERLNSARGDTNVTYAWQPTRLVERG